MTGEGEREGKGAAASKGDRILLAALSVYAALLVVAAFAQLTGNRFLLDLFDLRRLFTD